MTRDELLTAVLIERFGPDAAINVIRASATYDDTASKVRETFTADWPPAEAREQLADDLPPDSRPGPAIIIQAARS